MPCPIIDDEHPRCQQILRLDQLAYVLNVCCNEFDRCPIYQEQHVGEKPVERNPCQLRKCA